MGLAQNFGRWLLDSLGVIGLGLGGIQAAGKPAVTEILQDEWDNHPLLVLPPAELAAAVLKGHMEQGAAADEAARSGVNAERFGLLVETTGNPPGPETLLQEWRLGRIDDSTFERGLREGYLRDEWIQFFFNRRTEPLSLSEYVQANVQGYFTDEQLLDTGQALGYTANDVQTAQRIAGNPPGPTETVRMLNRGDLTLAEATQALRESRLKDKYIPAFLRLAETLVPARTITTLIGHGTITDQQADAMLARLGYLPEVRAAYIASAHKGKTSATHDLTLATVRSLYEDKIIDRATAVADLGKLGWSADEAGELLDLADAVVVQKFRNAGIAKVHSLYVAYKLERPQASTDMDGIGVPATQRDQLLALWDIERGANVKHLTVGELNHALKKGIIDEESFLAAVKRMGYDDADAAILAAIDIGVTNNNTAGPPPTLPTGA